jgi:hypothetical protein
MSEISLEDNISDLPHAPDQSQEPGVATGRLKRLKRSHRERTAELKDDLQDASEPQRPPVSLSEYQATPEIGDTDQAASPRDPAADTDAMHTSTHSGDAASPDAAVDKQARDKELEDGDAELDRIIAQKLKEQQQRGASSERAVAEPSAAHTQGEGAAKKRKVVKVTRVELSDETGAVAGETDGGDGEEVSAGAAAGSTSPGRSHAWPLLPCVLHDVHSSHTWCHQHAGCQPHCHTTGPLPNSLIRGAAAKGQQQSRERAEAQAAADMVHALQALAASRTASRSSGSSSSKRRRRRASSPWP